MHIDGQAAEEHEVPASAHPPPRLPCGKAEITWELEDLRLRSSNLKAVTGTALVECGLAGKFQPKGLFIFLTLQPHQETPPT